MRAAKVTSAAERRAALEIGYFFRGIDRIASPAGYGRSTKTLSCGEIVKDCSHEIRGGSEEEVLAQAGRHGVEAHGMTVPPEVVEIVRSHIRNDQ